MFTKEEVLKISKLTNNFYDLEKVSFSSTRQHYWQGWDFCCDFIRNQNIKSLKDIACGNLRFEKYINFNGEIYAIDNNKDLASLGDIKYVNYINVDIISSLILNTLPKIYTDCSVCFGFMHHIPDYNLRLKFINWMLEFSKFVIVSFWQFEKDEKICKKAITNSELVKNSFAIKLHEKGDYFLGWQNSNNIYRFCHSFSDDELDRLTFDLKLKSLHSFECDKYNKYLILKS